MRQSCDVTPHTSPLAGPGFGLVVVAAGICAATAAVAFLWRHEGGASIGDILPIVFAEAGAAVVGGAGGATPTKVVALPETPVKPPRANPMAAYAMPATPAAVILAPEPHALRASLGTTTASMSGDESTSSGLFVPSQLPGMTDETSPLRARATASMRELREARLESRDCLN